MRKQRTSSRDHKWQYEEEVEEVEMVSECVTC